MPSPRWPSARAGSFGPRAAGRGEYGCGERTATSYIWPCRRTRMWEVPSQGRATCVEILAGHSSWVCGLAFAPDGTSLASASWDGSVKLWELGEGGRLRQTLLGHTEQVPCLAWSPDGRIVASGSFHHTSRLMHR